MHAGFAGFDWYLQDKGWDLDNLWAGLEILNWNDRTWKYMTKLEGSATDWVQSSFCWVLCSWLTNLIHVIKNKKEMFRISSGVFLNFFHFWQRHVVCAFLLVHLSKYENLDPSLLIRSVLSRKLTVLCLFWSEIDHLPDRFRKWVCLQWDCLFF